MPRGAGRTVFRDVTQAAGGGTVGANLGTGNRWAVVIGIAISTRTRRIAPLRYAAADAESLFRFLTTRGGVKPVNVRLLLNRDATGIASGEMPQGRSAHTRYAMTRPFSRSPCSLSKSR